MSRPKRTLKPIPEFRSESEEREFWESHDSANYVDWSRAQRVAFPKLSPSTETISLRLPSALLADVKILANKRDVPYQSLLKIYLKERVAAEWNRTISVGAARPRRPRASEPRRASKK